MGALQFQTCRALGPKGLNQGRQGVFSSFQRVMNGRHHHAHFFQRLAFHNIGRGRLLRDVRQGFRGGVVARDSLRGFQGREKSL